MAPEFFHRVVIKEPKGVKPLGCEIWLDGIRVKGLINYDYRNHIGEQKSLKIEIVVDDLTIERKDG